MSTIPDSVRAVLESSALAHLVTLDPDGSPQVSIVWVGLDGDEIVAGHLAERRKVHNIRNDPRVVLSVFEQLEHQRVYRFLQLCLVEPHSTCDDKHQSS